MAGSLPEIQVSPATLRRAFNDSQLEELVRNQALRAEYLWDKPLRNPDTVGAPAGTRSQVIRFLDDRGQLLVEVHQYLRPDGTLGASGRPDPKRMRVGDEIWVAE